MDFQKDDEKNLDDKVAALDLEKDSAKTETNEKDQKDSDGNGGKKKKNRCLKCNKKVGLTGFPCRCGGLFCSLHRYSDKHDCDFDYKELGAEEIRKSNPLVIAKKVEDI